MSNTPFDGVTDTVPLIPLAQQQRVAFDAAILEGIDQLSANAKAVTVAADPQFDASAYPNHYLRDSRQDWNPPAPELLRHWCQQLKAFDSQWSQRAIAERILGVDPRRLRDWMSGQHAIPFDVCRKLLVAMGKVPQVVAPVVAVFE